MNNKQIENLEYLFFRYFEGSINETEMAELNSLLLDNDSAQDRYFEFFKVVFALNNSSEIELSNDRDFSPIKSALESLAINEDIAPELLIKNEIEAEANVDPVKPVKIETNRFYRIYNRIVSVAAILLLVFVVYSNMFPPKLYVPVATVIRQVGAEWGKASGHVTDGSTLYTGPVTLNKGLVEITLNNGAEIILEGPCEFILESDFQVYLNAGSLVANIENTLDKRLIVRTDNATVVDYGTEFGVSVDPMGNTTTQVFQGTVELRQGADPFKYDNTLRLSQDQGGQVNPYGKIYNVKHDKYTFIRKEQFEIEAKASEGSAYYRWKAYSYKLRQRDDLVAYYTFEKDDSGKLVNSAKATAGGYDGVLSSYTSANQLPKWVVGRWPQKSALRFNSKAKQYVEIDSPDSKLNINGDITLAAWVKIDNSMGGGHIVSNRRKFGQINYQLGFNVKNVKSEHSKVQFARYLKKVDNAKRYSKEIPEEDFIGWHLLVASHDNQNVKFYLDGKLIDTREYVYKEAPAQGKILIGSDRSDEEFGGNFEGVIGELAVFDSVLNDKDITQMYEAGRAR